MKFINSGSQIFIPDDVPEKRALSRTTHMGIGAHPDDLEFMALHGILECFQNKKNWFTGITVTNGKGSSRTNEYVNFTDKQMQKVRRKEQNKAAVIGEYSAMISLDYSSRTIKSRHRQSLVKDLKKIIEAGRPQYIYTHHPADRHDTHIAVAIAVIETLRELPRNLQPKAVYGCEGWRSLDWLVDEDKILLDVSAHENMSRSLWGVFDSQISGGKRYDLAVRGRKSANATFHASHHADQVKLQDFSMDLTSLIRNPSLNIMDYTVGFVRRLEKDVRERLSKFL